MPSFKIKPPKKINFDKKSSVTLDSKHREIVNDLDTIKTALNSAYYKLKFLG